MRKKLVWSLDVSMNWNGAKVVRISTVARIF